MQGMTLKQMARREFFQALEAYRQALVSKDPGAIVRTSVRVHAAKGSVPKRFWPLVGKAFRGEA